MRTIISAKVALDCIPFFDILLVFVLDISEWQNKQDGSVIEFLADDSPRCYKEHAILTGLVFHLIGWRQGSAGIRLLDLEGR